MAKFALSTLLLLTSSLANAASVPTISPAPGVPSELIPGPGLPSLESLGLTQEALFAMGPIDLPDEDKTLSKRQDGHCSYTTLISRSEVLACVNFLNALGTTTCDIPANKSPATWCTFQDGVQVRASPPYRYLFPYEWSAPCKDAAAALQQIYNNCNYDNTNQWGGQWVISGRSIVVYTEPGNQEL